MENTTGLKLWVIGGIITAVVGLGHHFIDNAFCFIDPDGCGGNLQNMEQIHEEDHGETFYDEEIPQNHQYH